MNNFPHKVSLLLVAALVVQGQQFYPKIVRETNQVGPDSYAFSYETEDGTQRQEMGYFVGEIWTVSGSYSFFDNSGIKHERYYFADDKGFTQSEVIEDDEDAYEIEFVGVAALVGGGGGGFGGYPVRKKKYKADKPLRKVKVTTGGSLGGPASKIAGKPIETKGKTY